MDHALMAVLARWDRGWMQLLAMAFARRHY